MKPPVINNRGFLTLETLDVSPRLTMASKRTGRHEYEWGTILAKLS